MEFDNEIFKILFAWLISYAFLEPIIALINYLLSVNYGMKTIFEIYPQTSPFLVVSSEFTYMTIVFIKTLYVYKYILKKPTYYPRLNNWQDYRDFIIIYTIVQILLDVLWTFLVTNGTSRIHFLDFLKKYSYELGVYSILRPLIIGIILLMFTTIILNYVGDLEAVATLMFSLFTLIIASF
jgi:hypothetical protein